MSQNSRGCWALVSVATITSLCSNYRNCVLWRHPQEENGRTGKKWRWRTSVSQLSMWKVEGSALIVRENSLPHKTGWGSFDSLITLISCCNFCRIWYRTDYIWVKFLRANQSQIFFWLNFTGQFHKTHHHNIGCSEWLSWFEI